MKIKNHSIMEVYVPKKLIFKNEIYEILNISPKFIINGYKVKTVNGKIDIVTLPCPHPNANPRTGEFCIPSNLRDLDLNKNTIKMIESMLSCFNLDDCYFTPWDEIEYRKQEVIGAWQRRNVI